MADKQKTTPSPITALLLGMLASSVTTSLHLVGVDEGKIKEIVAALKTCTPQEIPAVMGMLSSYYQARIMETAVLDWDTQRKEDAEKRRLSTGLTAITKLLQ